MAARSHTLFVELPLSALDAGNLNNFITLAKCAIPCVVSFVRRYSGWKWKILKQRNFEQYQDEIAQCLKHRHKSTRECPVKWQGSRRVRSGSECVSVVHSWKDWRSLWRHVKEKKMNQCLSWWWKNLQGEIQECFGKRLRKKERKHENQELQKKIIKGCWRLYQERVE